MLESGRSKGREGKAPTRQRRSEIGSKTEGEEEQDTGVPSVSKALATIAAGGLVKPRQVRPPQGEGRILRLLTLAFQPHLLNGIVQWPPSNPHSLPL